MYHPQSKVHLKANLLNISFISVCDNMCIQMPPQNVANLVSVKLSIQMCVHVVEYYFKV